MPSGRQVGLRVVLRIILRSVGVWSVFLAFLGTALLFAYKDCDLYWQRQFRHGMGTADGTITGVVTQGKTGDNLRDWRYTATYSFVSAESARPYTGHATLRYSPAVGEPVKVQYRIDKPEISRMSLQHFLPILSLAGWLSIFFVLLCVYFLGKGFRLLRIMKSGEITTAKLVKIRPYFSVFAEKPERDLPAGESAEVVAKSIPKTRAGYLLQYSFNGSDGRNYQAEHFVARLKPWMQDFMDGKTADNNGETEETEKRSRTKSGLQTKVIYVPGQPTSAYTLNDRRFEGFKITKDQITEDLAAWQWILAIIFETAIIAAYIVAVLRIVS